MIDGVKQTIWHVLAQKAVDGQLTKKVITETGFTLKKDTTLLDFAIETFGNHKSNLPPADKLRNQMMILQKHLQTQPGVSLYV